MIEQLLKQDTEINARHSRGRAAILHPAIRGDPQTFRTLLTHDAKPDGLSFSGNRLRRLRSPHGSCGA
ncbi:MAG: hypothetical protein LJE91_14605 [Gammaproteobacteria bacterium]|nr:hypothetical protein [Gammaproteobacteria bacterium]